MGLSGVQEWLISGVYGIEILVLIIRSVSFGSKYDFQEAVKLFMGSSMPLCMHLYKAHTSL